MQRSGAGGGAGLIGTVGFDGASAGDGFDVPGTKQKAVHQNEVATTCLFLPREKLFLIPFYDFALLRRSKKQKKRLTALRKECQSKYSENIRNLKKIMRGNSDVRDNPTASLTQLQ